MRARSLGKVIADLESGQAFSDGQHLEALVNWRQARQVPVHRWFRYREGFSPLLIKELQLDGPILDPFCGSGSIMVGAAQQKIRSIGIDINPLAVFVAETKLTPLSAQETKRVRRFLEVFRMGLGDFDPWPVPSLSIARKVFEPEILQTICALRASIETEEGRVRDFLLLAWLCILQPVGSYFKEGNGIKYRNKLRRPNGYVNHVEGVWQLQRFGADQREFALEAYAQQLSEMLEDTAAWGQGLWAEQRVVEGDALDLPQFVEPGHFRSIIFSPPYANRFDYFESLKVELWFGGFVNTYQDLASLRKRSLRSHLGANLGRPTMKVPPLEAIIDLMDRSSSSWRMGVPTVLRGYFDDMYNTLIHCKASIAQGGRCFIVVGNSAYGGAIVPTDVLIARLGREVGFDRAEIHVVRHLTVAPQQRAALSGLERYMRESVVELH